MTTTTRRTSNDEHAKAAGMYLTFGMMLSVAALALAFFTRDAVIVGAIFATAVALELGGIGWAVLASTRDSGPRR